jgi:uncharacterized membrane protein
MKKIIIIFVFLFLVQLNLQAEGASFTLSAEVTRSSTVNLPIEFVSTYIRDLDIYPKFFPHIISVNKSGDAQSEWVYRVEAPLSSPYNVKFILQDKSPSLDTLLFESIDKVNDYLYCRAVLTKLADNKTKVNFLFKISMTREKASDIHFLAGILGEKFLSEKMKERLESDMEDFISSAVKDMYILSRTSEK